MSEPPASPSIRPAEPADLDAVLRIEGAWPTTPKWTREHFEREMLWERAYFRVLEEAGKVAGYGGLWVLPPEAQVTTLAVSPDNAGRGLGRALMKHLHEAAARSGCSSVSLEVSAANAAALGLYRSLGYRVVGLRPKYYNDGSDAFLMTARL